MALTLAVGFEDETLIEKAKQLAQQLNLTLNNHAKHKIVVTHKRIVLKIEHFSPLFANFNKEIWQKRREAGKQQGLVRACKPASGVRIVDTTAGWGRDAAVLASFGAEVFMVERQPIMAMLLADALAHSEDIATKKLNIKLFQMDAIDFLKALPAADLPDVIYIDPMHPQRQKTALVKKEMQALQMLFGPDQNVIALIELAKTKTLSRVVVKWPQHLPPVLVPNLSIPGKTVRFDCYLGLPKS